MTTTRAAGLGFYLADVLNSDTSLNGFTNLQTTLTNYYNNSFGPAATPMEDYFVMFNGTSADPNLAAPPTQVTFNGNAYFNGSSTGSQAEYRRQRCQYSCAGLWILQHRRHRLD